MVTRSTIVWIVLVVLTRGGGWAIIRDVDNQSLGCDDTACSPCCTIQAAIEYSSGGDVVRVADGTYPENLDFRDMATVGTITLESASVPGAVVVSPASGHTVRHGDGYTNTVTIDGLEFTSAAGASCVYLDHAGDVVLRNVTANNCGYTAFLLDNTGTVTLEECTANQSARHGIQVDGASAVTLNSCTTSSNTMSGVLIINVAGAVQIIDPISSDNTTHGIDLDLTGTLTISGATITGNDERGIWAYSTSTINIASSTVTGSGEDGVRLESAGGGDEIASVTLTGLQADNNGTASDGNGAYIRYVSGPVTVTNSSFDGNSSAGFEIFDSVFDAFELTGGHASSNGANGVRVKDVEGPVTISGVTTNGNPLTGIRVDATAGEVVIEDCVSNLGLEEGIKIDADVGPVTVEHCTVADNALEGLKIQREDIDVASISVTRNTFTDNGDAGALFSGLGGAGPFEATCNDLIGNGQGMHLSSPVTVDARYGWWGAATGPSGLGPGAGDSVFSELGGTILFDPWLAETCAGCSGVVNLTLMDGSVDSLEPHTACYSITAGPNYVVYGPSGHLELTAPQTTFANGFGVQVDGSLTVRHP